MIGKMISMLLLTGVVIGIFFSVNYYSKLPLVYKSTATGKCTAVWTPDGVKDCSWLDENRVKKYEITWVR